MAEGRDITISDKSVPVCCSQRWILAYIGFLGLAVFNSLRVNLSVSVVCMVKAPKIDFAALEALNSTNISLVPKNVDIHCIKEAEEASHSSDRAELDWDVSTKELVLASFYYGYIVTQVPGGWLAHRYGGKKVLFVSILVPSVLTMLTPVCARTSFALVFALRVLLGLFLAMTLPSMHDLWGQWAPALERSKLTAVCYAGAVFGNVLTFSTSGLLCAYGFDNGWASIFYITGAVGVLWTCVWWYVAADNPSSHPRITPEEELYITQSAKHGQKKSTPKVPWLAIAKSPCLLACLTAHVCNNWTNATLLTNIPTFMKEVQNFDIKANGVLSAVPYICQFVSGIFAGHLADFLRARKYLSTTATRKLFQISSFSGAAVCMIGVGFCSCEYRSVAVALLALAMTFMGFGRAGYMVNHVDFAPAFAGVLFGITNTSAAITGMTAPLLVGYLTPDSTHDQWRNVFYVCAGFDVFGTVIFGLFASGEVQDWAKINASNESKSQPNMDDTSQDFVTREEASVRDQKVCEQNGVVNEGFMPCTNTSCRL